MTKRSVIRFLTIATFILSFAQITCGEHLCMPTILNVLAFLFVRSSFELWGFAYLLGTFGQIYVIAKPDKKAARLVYAICFTLLLFPIYTYYSYWQDYKTWVNSNIYWWFTFPFLVLGIVNLYFLFKKERVIPGSSNEAS